MNAVGKLGSYISRGVYTVSGPFHPFGGAVDIIVVQQPDGSFKSSPWYIRFGKFQGVLKTKEKIVIISVNGVEAGFHMHLDHKGEAHFLKDPDTEEGQDAILPQASGGEREERLGDTVEGEVAILPQTSGSEREEGLRVTEGGEVVISTQSSGCEREEILGDAQFTNTQSCKYDGDRRDSVSSNCAQNVKILTRTTSRRSGILGLLFGRRSMKENALNGGVDRVNSLERAEIAADLLELKWSTNLLDSNGSRKKPTEKKDFFPKKSAGEKEGNQQLYPYDVEQDCDGKANYSVGGLVDNFGTSIVEREHFEERTSCHSMHVTEEEMAIEMSYRKEQTTLRTVSINQIPQESTKNYPDSLCTRFSTCNHDSRHNPDRSLATDVLFEEKSTSASGLSSHVEAAELYTVETVGSAESNESTSNMLDVEGCEVNVLSKNPKLGYASFDVQSSDAPAISHDTLQELNDTFEASAFSVSSNGSGEQEGTCCNAFENSPVSYDISSKQTSRTPHLSISPISCAGHELKEDSEVLDNVSSVCLKKSFELADSVSIDAQTEALVSGAFLSGDGEVPTEFHSHGNAGSFNSDSGTSCQDVVILKHNQPIDKNTFNCSFPDAQEKDICLHPCSNGLLLSDQKTCSDGESKPYCIVNFHDYLNESSQINKMSFETNGVKSSCLSDMLNSFQDSDASSRAIAVEDKVKSSDSSEEEQFLFSDLDSFVLNENKDGVSFRAVDEKDNPHLLYAECEVVEGQTLKDVSNKELSEGLIDESVIQTSPMTIPKNKSSPKDSLISSISLPAIRSSIHDPERSNKQQPLSSSLNAIFEKTKGDLSSLKCSSSLDMEYGYQNKVVQDYCSYEAVASALDSKNDHALKSIAIHPVVELSLCRHLLYEGMGLGVASQAFESEKVTREKFHSLGPALLKNDKLVARIGGHYLPWNSAAPIVLQIMFGQEPIFETQDVILAECVKKNGEEDASLTSVLSEGSWNLWPFGFRRSKSIKFVQSNHDYINQVKPVAASMTMKSLNGDNDIAQKSKNIKKKVRWLTPSSEELTSLNLKEGPNIVTFSFSTAMLGRQQVDARIYLWKWNTQIVISDVDGTITRSDVLGQFMPLVGVDWSQTGVAHLFSAIKENGYQLLFLSARAISQAYSTRQFLFNLKQDGKELPHGPVVISPDGLFPSLYREVIRRAPHEFKISCLEAIKALFPIDCNPFYAGFGNRDTDEFSYLKVGIPRGKIFIINPKGEVAVNRRVDTKSYTSLHALVNDMFPPMSSREQEDFNSWNFWKLPLPEIAI
ncbi:phosphatidate phosphatase PAH2-like [Phalaenopsis equestris]|uniref:phosphatidate phosphatase PAH2-like n=1 Tax=Phalaenopsis equestris TaxID=78828 RepID=UPI0009E4BDF2|nr:phosphatidate phosphatase PAH2-like [Phalaenopsis equestris]